MRVGFDLDGVLFNFGDCVLDYLKATGREHVWKSGEDLKPTWDFYKKFREAWTDEEFKQFCHEAADAGYLFRGNVRPNAVEAVKAVKEMGHEIIVITDRSFGTTPEVSHRATIEWWEEYGFPEYDEIHFSADKTIVPTDVFVEDKYQNWEALMNAGTPCFLITRPWNDEYDVDGWRISDVKEYPAWVNFIDTKMFITRNMSSLIRN